MASAPPSRHISATPAPRNITTIRIFASKRPSPID